jgi:hypothetical protein
MQQHRYARYGNGVGDLDASLGVTAVPGIACAFAARRPAIGDLHFWVLFGERVPLVEALEFVDERQALR